MQMIYRSFLGIIFSFTCVIGNQQIYAQKASVSWGDEFKLKRGSTDLSVFHADKTGVYMVEEHMALKSYFVIGYTARTSASLVKLDKALSEVYKNDFNKELKGKEFDDFFVLKEKIYLLATSYEKDSKALTLHASEIDKNSGELKGSWQEVTSWQKETKSERFNYKKSYNFDSTALVIVSTNDRKEDDYFQIKQFDASLKQIGRTTTILKDFSSKTFSLEDIFYTKSQTIALIGRNYEYVEGKKQKAKNLVFTNYTIDIFNLEGNLVKSLATTVNGKWLMNTKAINAKNGELILAAFFSDTKQGKEINGLLVQRINPATGEIKNTSQKAISGALIDKVVEETDEADVDGEETKKERKEREKLEKEQQDDDGLSRYLKFSNIVPTDDGGIVLLAESYRQYYYTTSTYNPTTKTYTNRTYSVYLLGDILMTKIASEGQIDWLHILPKNQREQIQVSSGTSTTGLSLGFNSYFANRFNMPFYVGLSSIALQGDNINILFNDNPKNDDVLQLGQKVKMCSRLTKSACTMVSLNGKTGQYKRKSIFSNEDQPVAMVRHGVQINNDFYLVGKQDKMLGKSKIAVAKITFKP